MRISVIIPHWPVSDEVDTKLRKCVESLEGYDELVIVANQKFGFAKSVNLGLKSATGDYMIVMNNDVELVGGSLRDLALEGAVTSPLLNGDEQRFWGACFCVPRKVYEQIGGLDEQFEMGYFEDDDYMLRLDMEGVPMMPVRGVRIVSEGESTMKHLDNREEVFKLNQARFKAKHGL